MKKLIFSTLFLTASFAALFAQDTLHLAGPKDNYFSNRWLDSASFVRMENNGYTFPGDVVARFFQSKDYPIQVHGIAAILLNPWDDFDGDTATFVATYIDTSRANCSSSLRLYQYSASAAVPMVPMGDNLPVFATDDVSYYIDMGVSGTPFMSSPDNTGGEPFPLYPVYERYFSAPQTVVDTFYAGISFQQDWSVSNFGMRNRYSNLPFYLLSFSTVDSSAWHEGYAVHYFDIDPTTQVIDSTWRCLWNTQFYMFVFPILTPAPPDTVVNPNDTTVNPNDTIVNPNDTTGVGIGERELLQRYVAVSPNPATSSATVTSSFGLSQVDLYDPQGRLLKTFPAATKASSSSTSPATLSLTLDLSALPRGAYLRRILTPLGPTTKKLLLQ